MVRRASSRQIDFGSAAWLPRLCYDGAIQDLRNPPISICEVPDHVRNRLRSTIEIKRVAKPENIWDVTHRGISPNLIAEMLASDTTDSGDQSREARTPERSARCPPGRPGTRVCLLPLTQ